MQADDHSVVQAVLGGNKDAYGALVRAHSAAVFRVAVRIVGNEADAEEVVQETFLHGYQRLEQENAREIRIVLVVYVLVRLGELWHSPISG